MELTIATVMLTERTPSQHHWQHVGPLLPETENSENSPLVLVWG